MTPESSRDQTQPPKHPPSTPQPSQGASPDNMTDHGEHGGLRGLLPSIDQNIKTTDYGIREDYNNEQGQQTHRNKDNYRSKLQDSSLITQDIGKYFRGRTLSGDINGSIILTIRDLIHFPGQLSSNHDRMVLYFFHTFSEPAQTFFSTTEQVS